MNRVCSNNVRVNFMDNSEYKAICDEDRYLAQVKERLDVELAKIEAEKQQQRANFVQERWLRAQEAQALAAQQAAAYRQASEASSQSSAVMGITNQMQQLNNNLFMMRHSF